jgi:hypothetical protein
MARKEAATPEERARQRAKEYSDMMWHVATFVIINGFLWFIDLRSGGVDWAYWVTIGWGLGVAFHVAFYFIDTSGREGRKYQQFLAQERAKDSGDQD